MHITEITTGKREFMPLLLLADEQENMIDRYLSTGQMFVLADEAVKAVCVVTDEGAGILEIKNLAVTPSCQRCGLGRMMIDFLCMHFHSRFHTLQVGTGDSPLTVPFYERCGFRYSHRIPHFFPENYHHPIIEDGVLLDDMVYFQKPL